MKRKRAERPTTSEPITKKTKRLLEAPTRTKKKGKLFVLLESAKDYELAQLSVNAVDIKASDHYLYILNSLGTLYVMKVADDLEKGNTQSLPTQNKVVQISVGARHGACLLEDKTVFIWGGFDEPEYQISTNFELVQILKEEKCVGIASGHNHLLILTEKGVVYSMGSGVFGQLGRISERFSNFNSTRSSSKLMTPGRVHQKNNHFVDQIWASGNCSYYHDQNSDKVFTFGDNSNQKGAPFSSSDEELRILYHPVQSRFREILEVGEKLVLTKSGDIFCAPLSDEEGNRKWIKKKTLKCIESVKHCQSGKIFLINTFGELFSWNHEESESKLIFKDYFFSEIIKVEQCKDFVFIVKI